jgi:hypothetical protein
MSLFFDVNASNFDNALRRYLQAFPKETSAIITTQTRLLLTQLMNFTAPKSLAQGRAAVKRDIYFAMTPVDFSRLTTRRMRQIARRQDVDAFQAIMQRVPGWKRWRVEPFDPVKLHQNKRDSRGRIQHHKRVLVLDVKGHKAYVKKRQNNVGIARAGYAAASRLVGAYLPSWVARHGNRYGSVDDFRSSHTHPRVRIQNLAVSAISQSQQTHSLSSALRVRAKAMETDLNRRLRELKSKTGL